MGHQEEVVSISFRESSATEGGRAARRTAVTAAELISRPRRLFLYETSHDYRAPAATQRRGGDAHSM